MPKIERKRTIRCDFALDRAAQPFVGCNNTVRSLSTLTLPQTRITVPQCRVKTCMVVLIALCAIPAMGADSDPIVSVTGGRVRGAMLAKGGAVFKGIPYAQASGRRSSLA